MVLSSLASVVRHPYIMDLLNRLLPGRSRPVEPSSSSPSPDTAPTTATATATAPAIGPSSSDDCDTCQSPCTVRFPYPDHLKIDQGDMRGSVKRHRRHILVAQGRPHSRWPEEVTDQRDAFVALLSQLVRDSESRIGYTVRVSETDCQPLSEHDEDRADLYVFPDMLHFPAVSRQSLPQWVEGLLVHDRGAMHFQQPHAAAAERVRLAERAAAVYADEAEHSEWQPDVDFECRPVSGCALLICAHKQRDKRCGVTGPILAKQIGHESEERRQAEEREADMRAQQRIRDSLPPLAAAPQSSMSLLPVHTMLISHIGGHKFAGNVIAYPAGVWYGRVTPHHVRLLLDAHATQAQADEAAGTVVKQRIQASQLELNELRRGEVELEW